jgi:anti-sigma-K factor RskA
VLCYLKLVLRNELNEIEELFPFYALGVLSEEERAQVEAYVAKDASAQARLAEMIATAQILPFETTPVPPSASVKDSLMTRVRTDAMANRSVPQVVRPTQNSPNWLQIIRGWLVSPAFSTLAVAAVVLFVVWVVNLQRTIQNLEVENQTLQAAVSTQMAENQALRTTVLALVEENNLLREEKNLQDEVIALLTTPEGHEVPIAGTDHQPEAEGTLLVGSAEGLVAVFIAANLSSLPEGLVYQFWLIGDGVLPVGAGIFHSNTQGQGVLIIQSTQPVLSFNAIGVSIEPDGGSEQPTGDIVLLGNLSETGDS